MSVLAEALDGADIPKGKFLAVRAVLDFAGQAVGTDIEDRLLEIEQRLDREETNAAS